MAITSPRTESTSSAFPVPPEFWDADLDDIINYLKLIAEGTSRLYDGKINATGSFTLAASTTTTTVQDRRCGPNSVILWMPTTANAAGEMGMYITNTGEETSGVKSFVVNHGSDSRTDRTFRYVILG
jgi:hypothetical protein